MILMIDIDYLLVVSSIEDSSVYLIVNSVIIPISVRWVVARPFICHVSIQNIVEQRLNLVIALFFIMISLVDLCLGYYKFRV